MRNKKLIILFFLAALISTTFSEEGGILDPIFNLAGSARILAMGNAFTGLADEPGAMLYNTAGMTQLKLRGFVFETLSFKDSSIQFTSLGYINPVGKKGIFNLGIYNLSVSGIEGRDEENNITEKFSYQKNLTVIGFGWNLQKEWSLGTNLLIMNEKMLDKESSGFGTDLSLFYRPFNDFTVQIIESKSRAEDLLNSITSELYGELDLLIKNEEYGRVIEMLPGVLAIDPFNPKILHRIIKISRKKKYNYSDPEFLPLITFKDNLFTTDKVVEAYLCDSLILILLKEEDKGLLEKEFDLIGVKVKELIAAKELYINQLIESKDWDIAFYEIQKGEEIIGFKHIFIKHKLRLRDIIKREKGKHFLKKIGYEIYNQGIADLEKNRVKDALTRFNLALFLFDNLVDNRFSSGITFENIISPKLRLSEDFDVEPFSVKLGLGYRFHELNLLTSLQLEKTENLPVQTLVGLELLLFRGHLALRTGFNKDRVTAGLGIKIKNTQVDYAVTESSLGLNHKFSVTYLFGKEYARSPVDLFNQGELYYQDGKLPDAISSWEEALKLDPAYSRPRERLVEVNRKIDLEVDALLKKGEENYDKNNFGEALLQFKEVLTYRPNHFKANEYIIKIEAASKKYTMLLEQEALTAITNGDIQTALLKYNEILIISPNRKDITSTLN
ncbi:MAG TPA: tetratricopeptide repeat protein, partial [Firmicutes bacterium]|nr:tetratricopeptide repeat protein [Bacillota bacterium]